MPRLITPVGLVKLKEYKYLPHHPSNLERFLNIFWEWAVQFVPQNIAPNTITLFGFFAMVLSYVPMMFYDLTLTKIVPSWLFISATILHFIYQTADALDGKQARRTKASSPLGHLFDHGCDSFSVSFFLLSLLQAFQLGENHITIFLLFASVLTLFWLFSWNQCHTKLLKLNFGGVGITESQYLMMTLLGLTGIFGQSFWSKPTADFVPLLFGNYLPDHPVADLVLKTPLKLSLVYFVIAILVLISLYLFIETMINSNHKVYSLKQNLPFAYLMILFLIWAQTPFYVNYRAVVFLIFGTYYSLITSRLIIHGVTEDPYPVFHRELIALTGLTPVLLKEIFFPKIKLPFPEQKAFLIFLVFLTIISVYGWTAQIMKEISEHLGIWCFSVKPPEHTEPRPSGEKSGVETKKNK